MLEDWRGNPVSTSREDTLAAIDRFSEQILSYGNGAGAILGAAEADPDGVLVNTLAAALCLFLEDGKSARNAEAFLTRAEAGLGAGASERERMLLAAVRSWAARDTARAQQIQEEIASAYPRDILSAKFGQYHAFNRGDLAGMLRIAEKVFAANTDLAYMHGMMAFGYEQNHRLQEAEAAGRRAVEIMPAEPWAHHAVAHVMETQGRVKEGIAWMEGHAPSWEGRNSFMLTHNYWHLALFYMDLDRHDAVLDLYDRRIWGVFKAYSQDQINAASLLWRLELRGVDVGERWADVSQHVARRGPEHVEPFHDLHYVYALARGGHDRELASLLQSMRASRPASPWRDVALPGAEGVVAHAKGDHAAAFRLLDPLRERWQEIGGSHAQRDLFIQTWLDAALRAGEGARVRPVLEQRLRDRPEIAVCRRWLERAA
ncbi:MAG: tetratricopeptide repeat protein [Alphaproteobacteria bacterium]|nr:tetratricopeptide repeat protein [Alphaproteobacteria bacterium]